MLNVEYDGKTAIPPECPSSTQRTWKMHYPKPYHCNPKYSWHVITSSFVTFPTLGSSRTTEDAEVPIRPTRRRACKVSRSGKRARSHHLERPYTPVGKKHRDNQRNITKKSPPQCLILQSSPVFPPRATLTPTPLYQSLQRSKRRSQRSRRGHQAL
jgi:hypothetical protein